MTSQVMYFNSLSQVKQSIIYVFAFGRRDFIIKNAHQPNVYTKKLTKKIMSNKQPEKI